MPNSDFLFKKRDSVPSVCNVLRQWRIWLIPTYRVYRLYDIYIYTHMIMGLMHGLIIRCSECHLHVYIGIITPHEYYMILPALGISMLSVTTI